jgi:hypothetical protein
MIHQDFLKTQGEHLTGETSARVASHVRFEQGLGCRTMAVDGGLLLRACPIEPRVAAATIRVAMTVPVQTTEADGTLQMRFFLPGKYIREDAPRPLDPRIRLVTTSGETIAILRFSGSGHDFTERQTELIDRLAGLKWQQSGAPYTLNYDAPFTLPFLRRNEVAVAVMEAR